MKIQIQNCNNIDTGKIEIEKNKLNIKYGINGTGKSTIAKAIEYCKDDKKNISNLKPFKYYNNDEPQNQPNISGIEGLSKVKVFNENYLNDIVFQSDDELIKDSFKVFIKDDKYEKGIEKIDNLTKDLKEGFQEDEEINKLITNLKKINKTIKITKNNSINGRSNFTKACKGSNMYDLPVIFGIYPDHNYKWIKWQQSGQEYLELSTNCPYCGSELKKKEKEQIKSISADLNSNEVRHLSNINDIISELKDCLKKEIIEEVKKIIKNYKDGYTEDQTNFLIDIKKESKDLEGKLERLKNISFHSFKNIDNIEKKIKTYKINLNDYCYFNLKKLKGKISSINNQIDKILNKIGELKGSIIKQRRHLNKRIKRNKKEINDFLSKAGYRYKVDFSDNEEEYRLKLKPKIDKKEFEEEVQKVDSKLSYGEKNAFALVLFMFDALDQKPDLIILDDPISSFDKNKKYAIIDMLFKEGNKNTNFSDKTVLLLTHDFDPILDMIYHYAGKFEPPVACFLENKKGKLKEKQIKKEDIKTFMDITKENIKDLDNDINKLIYLRRYYEIQNNKENEYDLVSSLLHKREDPTFKNHKENGDIEKPRMNNKEIKKATKSIQNNWIEDFDYKKILKKLKNNNRMKTLYQDANNNYEKLQIYRIIFDGKMDKDDVIKKFINETFHIKNDYIYQLNPCKYELVPQWVIDKCNEDINKL